ncbi:hypothetical protein BN1723_006099 [Verticillium longisporum]|uniref:Uncharacterized protein n=1 Tax=Verticillium longisporum TaxID=100787 RepID=A0A0G4NDN3_VERLO|nr:hypothetical protein BN1723_006099 [Verticillium longisporum]
MWSRSLLASSALRAARPATSAFRGPNPFLLTAAQRRLLSDQTRQAIDKAVASAPVVLFMKGTPETPQCGFSRASIQVLGLQGPARVIGEVPEGGHDAFELRELYKTVGNNPQPMNA